LDRKILIYIAEGSRLGGGGSANRAFRGHWSSGGCSRAEGWRYAASGCAVQSALSAVKNALKGVSSADSNSRIWAALTCNLPPTGNLIGKVLGVDIRLSNVSVSPILIGLCAGFNSGRFTQLATKFTLPLSGLSARAKACGQRHAGADCPGSAHGGNPRQEREKLRRPDLVKDKEEVDQQMRLGLRN
jgi:hypothetical protein